MLNMVDSKPDSLQQSLARLHAELANAAHRLDAKSQQTLRSALADTERLLNQGGAPPAGVGAPHRLEALAVGFETDHPTLAASVRQFIALLGEAGL
jgi:Domain of unknown function (DUF4404)